MIADFNARTGRDSVSENPFVRYRTRLDSYAKAMQAGWSDADFVALVERLDEAVAEVDGRLRPGGHGFLTTPFVGAAGLTKVLELDVAGLWVKDDTDNVSGSHKARHLFGVALHLAVDGRNEGELAIASCGNAALGCGGGGAGNGTAAPGLHSHLGRRGRGRATRVARGDDHRCAIAVRARWAIPPICDSWRRSSKGRSPSRCRALPRRPRSTAGALSAGSWRTS